MSVSTRPDFREIDIQLLRTGNLADGTVKCKGRTWKVHRLLLASRLKFFKAAFFGSFQEATSGEVEFPEADPDAVDIMLRHLYGEEDLDVKDLKTPILCVLCWKLADYVQLDTLRLVAMQSLGDHFNAMALLATNGTLEKDQPRWLSHFFDAFHVVCSDMTTNKLQITFVSFLWVTRFETCILPQTLNILKKYPEVNEQLLDLLVYNNFNNAPGWIPKIANIEQIIKNRTEVEFDDEIICSRCDLKVNTLNEPAFYNPFPAPNTKIGAQMWCKLCVATFNQLRSWPWRNTSLRNGGKVKVEIWSWVSGKQDPQS